MMMHEIEKPRNVSCDARPCPTTVELPPHTHCALVSSAPRLRGEALRGSAVMDAAAEGAPRPAEWLLYYPLVARAEACAGEGPGARP